MTSQLKGRGRKESSLIIVFLSVVSRIVSAQVIRVIKEDNFVSTELCFKCDTSVPLITQIASYYF